MWSLNVLVITATPIIISVSNHGLTLRLTSEPYRVGYKYFMDPLTALIAQEAEEYKPSTK